MIIQHSVTGNRHTKELTARSGWWMRYPEKFLWLYISAESYFAV